MIFSDSLDLSWKVLVFVVLASTAILGAYSLLYPLIKKGSGRFSSSLAHASVAIFLGSVSLVVVLLATVDQEIQRKCFAHFAELTGSFAATRILGAVWLVGVATLLLRDLLSWRKFQSQVAGLSVGRGTDYQIVRDDLAASTIGFFKNTILIPQSLLSQPDTLKYVLAHERMHVKRKDGVWNLATLFVVRLAWFHPCAYLFARQRTLTVEMATDEAVLIQHGFSVKSYCEALLTIARANTHQTPAFASLGASQEYQHLKLRIGNLYVKQRSRKIQMGVSLLVLSTVWSFGVGNAFAAIQVGPAQDEELMCYQVQYEKIIESLFKAPPEANKCE